MIWSLPSQADCSLLEKAEHLQRRVAFGAGESAQRAWSCRSRFWSLHGRGQLCWAVLRSADSSRNMQTAQSKGVSATLHCVPQHRNMFICVHLTWRGLQKNLSEMDAVQDCGWTYVFCTKTFKRLKNYLKDRWDRQIHTHTEKLKLLHTLIRFQNAFSSQACARLRPRIKNWILEAVSR